MDNTKNLRRFNKRLQVVFNNKILCNKFMICLILVFVKLKLRLNFDKHTRNEHVHTFLFLHLKKEQF